MHLTYNNQALCDDFGLRIHLHTDLHKHVRSTLHRYISPLSLPQALHTAASDLPQKPDTLVMHSTPLIKTFWPIIVMLIILYPFIRFLSTCSFNQTPPLTTQLHIISYMHAGYSHEPVTSALSCSWLSRPIPPPPILDTVPKHAYTAPLPLFSVNGDKCSFFFPMIQYS